MFIKKFYKSEVPVEIIGSSSKRKIGRPLQCAKTLCLSKLDGIIEYLPEELYIKVKACTSISLIEEELKKNKQQLVCMLSKWRTHSQITNQLPKFMVRKKIKPRMMVLMLLNQLHQKVVQTLLQMP